MSPASAASTALWMVVAAVAQFVYGAIGAGLAILTNRVAALVVNVDDTKRNAQMKVCPRFQLEIATVELIFHKESGFGVLGVFIFAFGGSFSEFAEAAEEYKALAAANRPGAE